MIVANTPAGVRAAQRLDPPVPVLMMVMNDPVGAGLVSSLANPGNHTSGTASLNQDLTPKMLEFVREIFPKARVLAALFNPANPTSPVMMESLRMNGDRTGMAVLPFALEPRTDLDALFSTLANRHLDDRFHEAGWKEQAVDWWIPRLRLAERGAASWQDGGMRSSWR